MIDDKNSEKILITEGPSEKPSAKIMSSISQFILEGLSEKESCILAGYSYEDFKFLKKHSASFNNYFEKRRIEFKYSHLKNIQSKKTDKNSQWLLERLLPDEFGNKSKAVDSGTHNINILNALIRNVQSQDELLLEENVTSKTNNNSKKQRRITVGEFLK